MITLATKGIASLAIDLVHTVGMAERSNKRTAFGRALIEVLEAGDHDTVMQIAELIADSPKVGDGADWWQP